MNVRLMDRDRDVPLADDSPPAGTTTVARVRNPWLAMREDLSPHQASLVEDLGLDPLVAAMGAGDLFLLQVAWKAIFASLDDPEAIRYRQRVLADCLEHPAVAREMYAIAVDAINGEKRFWVARYSLSPQASLERSVSVLGVFIGMLRRLRRVAEEHGAAFRSDGFRRFFDMLTTELDDVYLATVEDHLRRLRFKRGLPLRATLGVVNRETDYVLRRPSDARRGWREWLGLVDRSGHTYTVSELDRHGQEALGALKSRGVASTASALGQSTDHILGFFKQLRAELGFYLGCLNLHDQLAPTGAVTCFPDPEPAGRAILAARGLYDIPLSLVQAGRVVGNDLDADDRLLVLITGANGGGKSTFLRSLGVAQLMMQSGMFVAAESFRADVRDRVFTHFKREEDASLRRGKLDEELSRMSAIVDSVTPNSLVLLNESFASTNEREGSEIARQIVGAMLASGVKVGFVTHLFDLADGFSRQALPNAVYLRAERLAEGHRTFKLIEGPPLPTSHGEDVYRRIFGTPPAASASADAGRVETGAAGPGSDS